MFNIKEKEVLTFAVKHFFLAQNDTTFANSPLDFKVVISNGTMEGDFINEIVLYLFARLLLLYSGFCLKRPPLY